MKFRTFRCYINILSAHINMMKFTFNVRWISHHDGGDGGSMTPRRDTLWDSQRFQPNDISNLSDISDFEATKTEFFWG